MKFKFDEEKLADMIWEAGNRIPEYKKYQDKIESIAKTYNVSLSEEQVKRVFDALQNWDSNSLQEMKDLTTLVLKLLSKKVKSTIKIEGVEIKSPTLYEDIIESAKVKIKIRYPYCILFGHFSKGLSEIEIYSKLLAKLEEDTAMEYNEHNSIKAISRNIYYSIYGDYLPPEGRKGIEKQKAALIYDLIAEFGLSPKWDIYNGIKDKYDAIKGYFWKNEAGDWFKGEE
jgi:hypothetical protein